VRRRHCRRQPRAAQRRRVIGRQRRARGKQHLCIGVANAALSNASRFVRASRVQEPHHRRARVFVAQVRQQVLRQRAEATGVMRQQLKAAERVALLREIPVASPCIVVPTQRQQRQWCVRAWGRA
jgi:hypothetical protein